MYRVYRAILIGNSRGELTIYVGGSLGLYKGLTNENTTFIDNGLNFTTLSYCLISCYFGIYRPYSECVQIDFLGTQLEPGMDRDATVMTSFVLSLWLLTQLWKMAHFTDDFPSQKPPFISWIFQFAMLVITRWYMVN